MRLRIRKDQKDMKGLLGGHRGVMFTLTARAEISADEQSLIDRYKVGYYTLATYTKRGEEFRVSVEGLLRGISTEAEDIGSLLDLESTIKSGCENLKSLLLVMATFGGEEVHEI